MTFAVADLLTEAAADLLDPDNVTWSAATKLGFLNAGQRELCVLKPAAYSKTTTALLAAGVTKQSLPSDALTLIRLTRNMGSGGATPGRAITVGSAEELDAYLPTWHSDTNAAGDIQKFVFDPLEPTTYYTYPKAPATAWYVELSYGAIPAACANPGNSSLLEVFREPLRHYILYRCYAQPATGAANAALAAAHYNQFLTLIGAKTAGEAANNPNNKVRA